jgi:hypothetical protein
MRKAEGIARPYGSSPAFAVPYRSDAGGESRSSPKEIDRLLLLHAAGGSAG